MSRTFSKILVICALVAVFPLLVVGTALAAYHSIDNTVSVEVVRDADAVGDTLHAGFIYNGTEYQNNCAISERHLDTIEIVASYSHEAYKFVGWFEGSKSELKTARENGTAAFKTDEKLSINMGKETNYIAVYDVVKYDMTYSYLTDPANSESKTTAAVDGFPTTLVYGAELPDGNQLPGLAEDVTYKFDRWLYNDQTVTNATFSTENLTETNGKFPVEVNAKYVKAGTANVYFVAPEDMFAGKGKFNLALTERWTVDDEKSLPTVEETIANYNKDKETVDQIKLAPGFKYFWTLNGEKITKFAPSEQGTVEILLGREVVAYSATVTASAEAKALMKDESALPTNVNFTVLDKSKVEELFNLEAKRSYNKVAGIKINNGALLTSADAIDFAQLDSIVSGEQALSIEVVMTNYFTKVTFSAVTFEYGTLAVAPGETYDANKAKPDAFSARQMIFDDTDEAQTNNTTTTLSSGNWFNIFDENGLVRYTAEDDTQVNFTQLQITFKSGVNKNISVGDLNKDFSVADFVEGLWRDGKIQESDLNESITILSLKFVFEEV